MAWRIEIARTAQKEIDSAGHQTAQRIVRFLFHRVARLDDPRSIGEALQGSRLGEFWKYRVGDHRLIVRIEDETVTILVVRVGHRREIYRGS